MKNKNETIDLRLIYARLEALRAHAAIYKAARELDVADAIARLEYQTMVSQEYLDKHADAYGHQEMVSNEDIDLLSDQLEAGLPADREAKLPFEWKTGSVV